MLNSKITAFYKAISSAQPLEKIKQLMDDINQNEREKVADIGLVYAASLGLIDIMRYLAAYLKYTHLPPHFSQALREASMKGHAQAVEFLLSLYEERENETMKWGFPIWDEGFEEALKANNGNVVSIYVNKFRHLTEVALLDAAVLGNFDIIKNLLDLQIPDINILKDTFRVVLVNENWEIVKYFLSLIENDKLPSDIFNEIISNNIDIFARMFYPELKQIRISLYSLRETLSQMDTNATAAIAGWTLVDSIIAHQKHFHNSLIENRKDVDENYHVFKKSCETTIENAKSLLINDPRINESLNKILAVVTNFASGEAQINDCEEIPDPLIESLEPNDDIPSSLPNNNCDLREQENDSTPALLALLPIRNKLADEANSEIETVVTLLLSDMEDAIKSHYKDKTYNIIQAFNIAIETARPILEQHPTSGWKKIIDDAVNAIYKLLPNAFKSEGSFTKHISFFAKASPLMQEIEQARIQIQTSLIASENDSIISEQIDDVDEILAHHQTNYC
ncbi:hypothetical protein [Legionella cardiaca]|uniref:Ankyrin repeat protein n=1 Tax=Legionella cardiaca TaxID=1071983 RepID=A0ABY8ARZ7_9GAMM|nr:hypothetical protein [Legionella cardiaca]WED41967.1 hypothetical protein PXX05_08460 [Legionella cardiaca]